MTTERLNEKELQKPEKDSKDGDDPKDPELIRRGNETAERLEKANEAEARNLKKREELMVEDRLGGRSDGGEVTKPKEETAKEYAEKAVSGELNEKE